MGSTDECWQPPCVRGENSEKNGGGTAKTPGRQGENSNKKSKNGESDFEETLSGLRIWPGLVPVAREMYEEHEGAVDKETVAERVCRQYERYQWFRERIDDRRPFADCVRVLRQSRRAPGAWERALVELSMSADVEARVFLETWEPPGDEPVVEEFRKVCAAVAGNR